MGYITGENRIQITLYPESIDEYINDENSVRVIDVYVEKLGVELMDI